MTLFEGIYKKKNGSHEPVDRTPRTLRLLQGFLLVLIISYFSYTPESKPISKSNLKAGEVLEKDVVVTRDLTIEDNETTALNRRKAMESLIPIYAFFPEKLDAAMTRMNDWFLFMKDARKSYLNRTRELSEIAAELEPNFAILIQEKDLKQLLSANTFQKIDFNRLLSDIRTWGEQGILTSVLGMRKSSQNQVQLSIPGRDLQLTPVQSFLDLKNLRDNLSGFLQTQSRLNQLEREIALDVILEFVPVTVAYSQEMNRAQEKKASESVNPAFLNLKKGKVIIRRGEEVTPEQMKLVSLILSIENTKKRKLSPLYFLLFFWTLAYVFLRKYQNISGMAAHAEMNRHHRVIFITLLSSAMLYKVIFILLSSFLPLLFQNIIPSLKVEPGQLYFALPFGFGAMMIAFLFNIQSVLLYSIFNAVLAGFISEWNAQVVLYVLVSNIAMAVAFDHYQRLKRSSILKAGFLWLLPANICIVFLFALIQTGFSWNILLLNVLMAVFSALLATFLASFLIPLWEVIFKLVTELKMVELTNLNLPIFREMLEKAPGTYHHSQMVASMAEATAQDLDLSPLILRGMALYHDIGKIEAPHFYTENHSIYTDPHARISPKESAKTIIGHIASGLETAEKLKLPKRLKDGIARHHGTKLVKFFYQKEKENRKDDPSQVNEDQFRYPGPRPQNIEDAVIMLADQIEAASKSLSSPTDEEIKNIIERIISANIEENQFDECRGLTFMALKTIAGSFFHKLASIYHQRVSYPGFQFSKGKLND